MVPQKVYFIFFIFTLHCGAFKAFIKLFVAPQRSVKIKFHLFFPYLTFFKAANLLLYLKVGACKLSLVLSKICRSSCSQMLFKIDILKNFANFTVKHLCWSPFLIKLQVFRPATELKRDSNRDFFL